jgi:hypothetical protein
MAYTEYIRRTRQLDVLKWLRQGGERGVAWEFSGGNKAITIRIYDDKLNTAYILAWEWGNPDPKNNRT